ncbi:hypothetical protein NDU88_000781 [Pleurodeles waltl]|uniref:Uncharacterized protein n=1 Tax=Pleurodeles waltl TaxID=8319 RepID=A0AAV7TI85_PLEWA|nr:hypothetical protein NDU88_000781 [Pleurodeles waltl]
MEEGRHQTPKEERPERKETRKDDADYEEGAETNVASAVSVNPLGTSIEAAITSFNTLLFHVLATASENVICLLCFVLDPFNMRESLKRQRY